MEVFETLLAFINVLIVYSLVCKLRLTKVDGHSDLSILKIS